MKAKAITGSKRNQKNYENYLGVPKTPFVSIETLHRIVIIFVVIAYLALIATQQNFNLIFVPASEWIFLGLVINLLLLILPLVFYQSSYGWFHPLIFRIFLTTIIHLRRTPLYIYGLQWHVALLGWDWAQLNSLVTLELGLRALGTIAIYIGFFLSPNFSIPKLTFRRSQNLEKKILLVVGFAVTVFLVYIQLRGGLTSHILSWARGRRSEFTGDAYWFFLIQLGLTACLCWLALDRKAPLRPNFWICSAISLIISFLSTGSRGTLVYFIAMGVTVSLLREQKISFTKPLMAIIVGLMLLGLLGNFRTSTFTGEVNWDVLTGSSAVEESSLSRGVEEVTARSGIGSAVFPVLAKVPDQVEFLKGDSYLAVLTLPIPRALWADKPGLIGGRSGATFFGSRAGIPPGAVGEAYWNFGVPGVLVHFLVIGMFYRWIARIFCQYPQEPSIVILYIITLFPMVEPSSSDFVSWLTSIGFTSLFLWMIGVFQPSKSPSRT